MREYSREMSLRNPLGDFEITDPRAMRALAHPVRLAALSHLQRHGPATATQLAEHVGATPSVTSWHLRHLASFGLVTDGEPPDGVPDRRQRWWQAAARGFRFDMPDSTEGREAGRLLRAEMMTQALATVQSWLAEVEPTLDEQWTALAGSGNTGIRLTVAEARRLEREIERLLAPYVQRGREKAPRRARDVRLVRFLLPEPVER
jgi:DNA-binding transcriptional ArsR family regulator